MTLYMYYLLTKLSIFKKSEDINIDTAVQGSGNTQALSVSTTSHLINGGF